MRSAALTAVRRRPDADQGVRGSSASPAGKEEEVISTALKKQLDHIEARITCVDEVHTIG